MKDVIYDCADLILVPNTHPIMDLINAAQGKKWFDKECQDARKYLTSLDTHHEKETYQRHLVSYKALLQRKQRRWEVN